jgi:hypothetical protein
MWRCLQPDEVFVFGQYNAPHDRQFVAGLTVGYCIQVSILPFGHENCGCMRSCQAEVIHMFREHLADTVWPVSYTIMDVWLAEVQRAGFGVQMPGWIVAAPHGISWGFARPAF